MLRGSQSICMLRRHTVTTRSRGSAVGSSRFSGGARVAAAFALAGALVACSSGAKPNTDAGKGQGPVKDPTKPVTVTFSSWVGGDPTMKKFAADFHKLHPNITIQFQNVNAD